jgi:hypothetical protein
METPHTHSRALSTVCLLVRCDEFTRHATPSTHVSVTLLLHLFGPNFQVKTQFSNEFVQFYEYFAQ